jgi:HEAT repeat protein
MMFRSICLAALAALLVLPCSGFAQGQGLSVEQLLRNLESDNPSTAASAARTLGVMFAPGGGQDADRAKVVTQLVTHLASKKSAIIRRNCAVALGKIRAAEAADPMKQALSDEEVEVVMAAGEAVAQILSTDEARNYLTEVGGGDSLQAKIGAYHGLATIAKPQDAPFLLKGVESANWRIQQATVKGLERAVRAGAELDAEQYKTIAKILGADTANAANAAVHFFTHTHQTNALAALRDAADPEVHQDNWRQRAMALRAIRHRGWPRSQPEMDLVIRNLGDKTVNVTNESINFLNYIHKEHRVNHRTLMPVLVSELERAEPLGRRAAIMKQMPNNVDPAYASRAAAVAAKTLAEASKVEAEWVAHAEALRLIGGTGYSGVMADVANSINSNVANVRNAAGQALQRLGSTCPAEERALVAPILLPLLTNPVDWRKSSIAAGSVGGYADDATIAPLVDLLAHSVVNVRAGASKSLVVIAESGSDELRKKVDAAVHPKLEGTPTAWQYGAPVLGALKDIKAVPLLTSMLASSDWRAQEQAGLAVARLADNQKVDNQALSQALVRASQSEVLQVQRACDTALRNLSK